MDGRNEEDRRIYERSARLILLLALRDVLPGATVRFEHSIGRGIYMTVKGASLTAARVRAIEQRMHEISEQNLPITRARWTREEAKRYFAEKGQEDTVRLLRYRPFDYFDVYTCDGFSEYFYGDMAKSTGEIASFALRFYYPGMVLMLRPSRSAQTLTILMGVALLAEGILSLCVALCAIKVVKKPSDAR